MKKIVLTLLLFNFCIYLNAQQNTFPTIGNVGIGTISPTEKLTVNGAFKVEQGSILNGEVKMPNLPIATDILGQGTNQIAPLFRYLIIDENGVIKRGNAETPIGVGEVGDSPCTTNGSRSRWYYGNYKTYIACPDINVGISTSTPRVKLDVIGTTYSQKMVLGNLDPSLIGNKLLYLKSPSNFSGTDKLISVNNSSGEIFSINDLGEVESKKINVRGKLYVHSGINRNDPNVIDVFGIWSNNGKLLQVNSDGLLLVREIKLNQSWADYVFEKQYPLMPLKEVEKFVLINKHLPNVPTAKEIEENGIGLSETNRIFIEKIEELTLYLIEQDKDMSLLKAKINSLEKELDALKQK